MTKHAVSFPPWQPGDQVDVFGISPKEVVLGLSMGRKTVTCQIQGHNLDWVWSKLLKKQAVRG